MEDNRKIDLLKNEIPYMEKFMVPQMYDIFCNSVWRRILEG